MLHGNKLGLNPEQLKQRSVVAAMLIVIFNSYLLTSDWCEMQVAF